jgi:DNA-binding HxlR family transcriptional regulator
MDQGDGHQPDGEIAATLSERLVRGEVFSSDCPSRAILQHVTSRWGVLALVALARGEHRFSELRRKTGASERMLAQTLQRLEADGLVLRVSHPVVPPHVEYSLTPLGRELAPKVETLADWIEENLQRVLTAQYDYAQRRGKGGDHVSPAPDADDATDDLDH